MVRKRLIYLTLRLVNVQRVKTQYLCFKLYLLKYGGNEYLEGQSRVEQDYACLLCMNVIHSNTPSQEVQEKRKGSV